MTTLKHISKTVFAVTLVSCISLATQASAVTIYTDGFDTSPGDQNGTQLTTTLAVQFNNTYVNWGVTAGPVAAQVDLNPANAGMISGNPESLPNPNDWAAMLFSNQVLLSNASISANNNGHQYTVDFIAGPANYATDQGSLTANGNALRIEVVDNNGAGAVIGTTDFTAIDFSLASALDLGLSNGSFMYTGNGNGNVKIRISGLGSGVFNGSIDEISVSVIPEPSSFALMSLAITGLGLIRRRRNRPRLNTDI